MLKALLSRRLVQGGLVFVVLMVVGSTLYYLHVQREIARETARTDEFIKRFVENNASVPSETPATETEQGGHWHGDEWHAEPHTAQAARAELPPSVRNPAPTASPAENTLLAVNVDSPPPEETVAHHPDWPEGFPPPDKLTAPYGYDYHGLDELGFPSFKPHLPEEKLQRIREMKSELSRQWRSGEIESEEYSRLYMERRLEILTEGMSALGATKYLKARSDTGGASLFAEKALAENPDDFETLLLYSQLQHDKAKREAGFRRLVQLYPTSHEALKGLAIRLEGSGRPEGPKEALALLQQIVALDTFESQPKPEKWSIYHFIGDCHANLGDSEQAFAYFKKAISVYPQNTFELFSPITEFSYQEIEAFLVPLGVEPWILQALKYQKEQNAGNR